METPKLFAFSRLMPTSNSGLLNFKFTSDTWKQGFLPSLTAAPWEVAPQSPTMGHITGNYKKNWEWFGWYRDHNSGHLWLEQDIHIREVCLGKLAQSPTDVWCYHQFHAPSIGETRPGYSYHTEGQARLLEPAPSEREG